MVLNEEQPLFQICNSNILKKNFRILKVRDENASSFSEKQLLVNSKVSLAINYITNDISSPVI